MAEKDITPTAFTTDEWSGDLPSSGGDAPNGTGADNGWSVDCRGMGRPRIMLRVVGTGGTDTVTVQAGDKPPAERSGLGDLSITLGASDERYLIFEGARFMREDGTILVYSDDASTTLEAFELPI